ncbi:MAG: T9SS C-terminal target domain-containing protein [Balneola sp.]|nr:MAG: T9SS C-terminal target domain-containing protein [Balneola sp.]
MIFFKPIVFASLFLFGVSFSIFAQSSIPPEYRGAWENQARGVLYGNEISTNFRNHGEHSRWGDFPWGFWPDGGSKHIDGMGFIIAGRVPGERAKWEAYFGEGATDTTLTPVIINYKEFGKRISPYNGNLWAWTPLNGFHNPNRLDPTTLTPNPIPATSTDKSSWPTFWPDRLDQTDSGWEGVWNGYRGKGIVNGAQETFYVMDDLSDYEYLFGLETDGPHSELGVYYPIPSDSTIGGLGIQTEVRTFQFADQIAKDMLFTHYRTTNVSEKDLKEVWTAQIVDVGLGNEENDDDIELIEEENLIILKDDDGLGISTYGQSYDLGVVGILLLEHSLDESNGIDDDNDGIIDESKFNDPGEYLVGKSAIDTYLNQNYNMERFNQLHIDLDEFPAYRNERWWTGDEDMDWIAYDDLNKNGVQDSDEPLQDDVGRDGLGPTDENYPGPDEGEADGIPTKGEPNFGELDMLESENRDISFFDVDTRPFFESGNNLRDDTWLFNQIYENQLSNRFIVPGPQNDEPFVIFGTGPIELKVNSSMYFITALVFAATEEELFVKVEQAKAIYESDYGQSMFLTNSEEDGPQVVPTEISLSQNYPNPFNPTTNIEFSLSRSGAVTLEVLDITGRKVQTLISDQNYNAGIHSVQFDAGSLSSGIYIYRLEVAGQVFTRKLTLIK